MKIILTILSVLLISYFGFAQTSLTGKVIEEETGDPVIYGSVALYKNDVLIMGIETDFDGLYSFNNMEFGTYDVEVSYVGFAPKKVTGVVVIPEKSNTLNISMTNIDWDKVIIMDYCYPPIIEQDDFTKGRIFSSSDIRRSPVSSNN